MVSSRIIARSSRALFALPRPTRRFFSISASRSNEFEALNKRTNDTSDTYRRYQIEKPLNPHLTNTTSTITNEIPSVGKDKAPPELVTNVDPKFTSKDSVPENTQRMTGGTQKPKPVSAANDELGPLRRTGEDANTMRARLLYQSRKRGTLESDLLLSTFADTNLATMPPKLLQQYDLFLDENDWDIYYWATQEPSPTSQETAEGSGSDLATPNAQGKDAKVQKKDEWKRQPASGEWAQTVGTFKPAYRPVPQRWKGSEILSLLRRHVKERSAGGVMEDLDDSGKGKESRGKGLGMMPDIKNFDA
ncbi:Flavinator of succinate dehydrogenase-domain-containing protein [Phaeosphaeriaceae sp. PMI808]|nr:Flavinator of succinate dehydrogenase-domain-containing protein [Phaeosphaeriaceae sp. PMI808]